MLTLNRQDAHVGVIGQSGTGKTTYVKTVLDGMVNSGYVNREDIHVFTTNSDYLMYQNHSHISDLAKLWKRYIAIEDTCIIVFDDFNNDTNTNTNPDVRKLFTEGRKYGIHGVIIGHTVKSFGKEVRGNLHHKVIFGKGCGKDFCADIAGEFTLMSPTEIVEVIKNAKRGGPHSYVHILDGEVDYGTVEYNISGDRNVINTGYYHDESVNIETNTEILNLQENIKTLNIKYELMKEQDRLEYEYKAHALVYRTIDLCHSRVIDYTEFKELQSNLVKLAKKRINITDKNTQSYANLFLKKHNQSPCCFKTRGNMDLAFDVAVDYINGDKAAAATKVLSTFMKRF